MSWLQGQAGFLHSLRARVNAQTPLRAEVQSPLNFRWSKQQNNKTATRYLGALRDRFTLKQDTYTHITLNMYTCNSVMISCTYRGNFKITHLAKSSLGLRIIIRYQNTKCKAKYQASELYQNPKLLFLLTLITSTVGRKKKKKIPGRNTTLSAPGDVHMHGSAVPNPWLSSSVQAYTFS